MSNLKMKIVFYVLFFFSTTTILESASAAEASFEYPELSVVPRATERLDSETVYAKDAGWKVHLPYLVPATTTFVSGLVLAASGTKSDVDPFNTGAKYAPWVGMGVGAAWWGLTLGVLNHLDIYEDGAAEIAKLPVGTQREKLLRERRAEEAIFRAGSLARKLKWISVISNLGASGFMAAASKDQQFSLYLAIGSAVTALSPLIFTHRWETTESTHRDYKKRIYAPVVGATILSDPNGLAFYPGLLFALRF